METTHLHPARGSRRRWRRPLLLVGLLGAIVLSTTGCFATITNNRAKPVAGATNGQLPTGLLATAAPGCTMFGAAAADLGNMLAAAAKDGITLRAVSCYRNYAGQVAARESWCAQGACSMAAVPGSSNHGWGKAVDLSWQGGSVSFGDRAWEWLCLWAAAYNFRHPESMGPGSASPEGWHWEWVGDGGTLG